MDVFKKGKMWYIDYHVDGQRKREIVGYSHKMAENVLARRKVQIAKDRFSDVAKKAKTSFKIISDIYIEYAKNNKFHQRDKVTGVF